MRADCLALILSFLPVTYAEAFLTAQGTGPPEDLHPEVRVMRTFAPVLWLATDEPTMPMLPHALAFDGQINFGGSEKDLNSLAELEWDIEASYEDVVRVIDEQSKEGRLRARVLYKLPALPPAYHWSRRVGDRYVYALEYWFYYPYDRGMGGGHKGDSEHAFVFVAIDKELEVYDDLLEGNVVGVVGAGHETHTANNVLVAGRNADPRTEIFPTVLPNHLPILVERGKHASAPDRNFDGRFDVGADVNLFRDAAWGSRDIEPSSFFHIIGDFKDWYSLPRNDDNIWIESQYEEDAYYGDYTESYRSRFPKDRSLKYLNRYTLFPMQDLACLYQLLGRDAAVDASCSGSVEEFLSEHKDCFWLDNPPTSTVLSPGASAALRRWPDRKQWKGDTHHIKLLEHPDAQDPNNIFKLHLYPTVSLGGGVQWDDPSGSGMLVQGSIRVAEITFSGTQWLPNSMFEVNFNFDTENWQFHSTELHYLFFRGGYSGFYGGINIRRERLAGTADLTLEAADEVAARIGQFPDRAALSRTRWGIDVGWAVSLNFAKFQRNLFFDTKIGLRADIFNDSPSDVELALGAQNRVRLVVSVGVRKGIAFPKNPLTY